MSVRTELDAKLPQIVEVCRRYRVRELRVFGSVLRDDFREDSDIDLLVDFTDDARIGYLDLARMQIELEDMLGRKVDVVLKDALKELIRDRVLTTSELMYAA